MLSEQQIKEFKKSVEIELENAKTPNVKLHLQSKISALRVVLQDY